MFLGDLIKEYRISTGLSLREFAKRCGLSHTYISALEKNIDPRTGKPIAPTLDTVKYVSRGMNKSIEDILKALDEQQEFIVNEDICQDKLDNLNNPVTTLPVLGTVKAGYNYLAQENWIDTVDVEKSLVGDGKDFFALKVIGDSMAPILTENDIVIVQKQNDFKTGDIVVAIINGDEATIKKGKKGESSILLQPLNPNYEPLIFTYDEMKSIPITIVGIVKQLKRNF